MYKTFSLTLLLLATILSNVARADENLPPKLAENADKEAILNYRQELAAWASQGTYSPDEFWDRTCDGFYNAAKRLLSLDLTKEEELQYQQEMAGILGNYTLHDALIAKTLGGPHYDELLEYASKASEAYAVAQDEETQAQAKAIYLAYAGQLFNVRLRLAISLPEEEREDAFVSLVGDVVTFALALPDYGADAFKIVQAIRAIDAELGEEAIDALCDAFEASGNPALAKPVAALSGERRYARLPGSELYFEALFPNEKGEYVKPFDPEAVKGKAYLVEVWATWCTPCRKEIPRLKEVYDRYHDAGFEIFGYSIDLNDDVLQKFLVDNEVPWPVASQKHSIEAGYHGLYDYYSIKGVPEMILVGPDGKVVEVDCRGCKLADALKELYPDVKPLDWDPQTDFSSRVFGSSDK